MNDWAYTLCPMRTRQLVNPHASMEVPVADLKWAPGGRGSKGGILSTYTVRSSCNSGRRWYLLVLNTSHHLTLLEYVPLYPHSVLYLIFFPLPPSPLLLSLPALIVIGVLLLVPVPPPRFLLWYLLALRKVSQLFCITIGVGEVLHFCGLVHYILLCCWGRRRSGPPLVLLILKPY